MGQPCDKGGESRFWGEKQVFGVRNKFSGLRNKFRNKFLFWVQNKFFGVRIKVLGAETSLRGGNQVVGA